MEICSNFVVTEPVISTTFKKNQSPVYDTLGPFPDETILSGLDRALSFLGANKVRNFLNLPTPNCDCNTNSDCSVNVSCPDEQGRPRSISKSFVSECGSACEPTCLTSGSRSRSVTICESTSLHGDETSPKKTCTPMKRSFSLCSLACRKLKKLLFFHTKKEGTSTWLWTHLQSYADGSRVLQIFENMDIGGTPPNVHHSRPKIIFVVLSNGSIVPFESLRCHK